MKKILLIDGNNFMYAAQHGSRKLTAGDLEVTAIFGFMGSLRNVMLRFPGATPIVLWDSTPNWRVDVYPEYKGNRKLNPALAAVTAALRPQRPILKDLLRDLGIRQFAVDRHEADDLAADLARKYSAKGGQVVLVTRDGDWQQLVNQETVWYDHKNDKVINLANFKDETGYLDPIRFVHGKAIHGDVSDNIPGVGGLGEGAATLILSEFPSLTDLAAAWPVFEKTIVKGHAWSRYKKKIQAAFDRSDKMWDQYNLNLKLMNLLERDYGRIEYRHESRYSEDAVKRTFAKLGFHSILHKYDQWVEPIKKGAVV